MKARNLILLLVILAVLFILFSPPFFILQEGEQAVVTQFGRPVGGPFADAGLYFRIPIVQDVHYFEKRILKWDGKPNQIPTRDKTYIWVDTTARWRITDPLLFLQSVSTTRGAMSRLDDIFDSVVRDLVSGNDLDDVVRSSDYKFAKVNKGRQVITASMQERAKQLVPQYGIELIDIQIKRINYEDTVRKRVYEKMISERKRIASELRSQGEAEKERKLGALEKELARIRSEAYKTAQETRGKADAQVTQIYGEAFGQDPDFYALFKTLESYSNIPVGKNDLILSTDGDYYKYLKQAR
jgi:membrane protease subunit HflC